MGRIVRFAVVMLAVSAALFTAVPAARAGTGTTTTNPYSYVLANFVDFSANSKPFQGFYGAELQSACPNAAAIDASAAVARDVGVDATVGDRTGRVVARARTQDLGAKAKKAVAALRTPACLAYAADAVVSGVLSQYPTRPGAPAFAAATTDTGGATRLDFTGTSTSGPFSGAVVMAGTGDVVNLLAVRVANAQSGEVEALVNSLAPTVRYAAEVESVDPPAPKLFTSLGSWASVGDAAYLESLRANFPDVTSAPAPRATAPSYPPGCDDAFDAFVYSGQRSALGGTAITGGGGQARVRITPQVFANSKDVKTYLRFFDDLSACTEALYAQAAGGQQVAVTRAPAKATSTKPGECAVVYTGAIGSPVQGSAVFGLYVAPKAPRAVTVNASFATTPGAQAAASGLCAALDSAYGKP